MKSLKLFIVIVVLTLTIEQAFAVSQDLPPIPPSIEHEKINKAPQEKEISNQQLLDKIKNSIRPVELKEEENDINIHYDFPTSKLQNTSRNSNINMSVVDQADKKTVRHDILSEAYQASLIGQFEASIALYKKALLSQPDDVNTMYALATMYHKLHQYKEARTLYMKVLAIDPDHPQALNNYLVVLAEESPTKALMEFKELEKINPHFSPVQAQMGMVYAKLGEYELAEKYLKKAVEFDPEILNYRYNLAVLYDKMHRFTEAAIIYKQLLAYNEMGESLPASPEYIKSRLVFLTSKTHLQQQ